MEEGRYVSVANIVLVGDGRVSSLNMVLIHKTTPLKKSPSKKRKRYWYFSKVTIEYNELGKRKVGRLKGLISMTKTSKLVFVV